MSKASNLAGFVTSISPVNNLNVGVVTATGGFNIGISSAGTSVTSGPVTRLNFIGAGNTFAVNGTTVDVSIAGGGGGSSQWVSTTAGIHTLSNVGVGTTNPTSKLTVSGNVLVTGVVTATSFVGDGSGLTLAPQIINFSPAQLATGVGVGTNITLTFDQTIQFSGVGTIRIRETSATGTIIESFTCGVSTRATISGSQLIIDPTNDLSNSKKYYVTLPSVGIANTLGAYYKGTEAYFFNTQDPQFSAQGGTYVYTLSNPLSPTGYYKYHVFTSTGVVTTTSPSVGTDLEFLMIGGGGSGGTSGGGGGGAGGLIARTGPTLALSPGTYTITVGGGAPAASPAATPGTQGTPSKLAPPSPTAPVILEAIGGGYGNAPTTPPAAAGPGGSGGGYGSNPARLGGGTGTPGQGNPGGNTNPPTTTANTSGGGGGAGGSGGTSPGPFASPPTIFNIPNGDGGAGSPNTAFASPFLSGYVPVIPPTTLTAIGPTGLYAGGGGGGSAAPSPSVISTRGAGGPGGGGAGGQAPMPTISPIAVQSGQAYTGGGGGGGEPTSPNSGAGGSGIVMLRYASPAP